jgi:uncharacterized protein
MRRSACSPTRPVPLGEAVAPALDEVDDVALVAQDGWFDKLQAIGKPLILGLAVFAVVGGIGTWAMVHLAWTVGVQAKRRRRLRHGRSAGG